MKTVEYFNTDTQEWVSIDWANLTSGLTIRIKEDDVIITDETGVLEFHTISDSYKKPYCDTWIIDVAASEPIPIGSVSE
jgi:hypothetical protein